MIDKKKYAEKIIDKLKRVSSKAIKVANYELALNTIAITATILYKYNQYYADKEIESMLLQITKEMNLSHYFAGISQKDTKTILFYDGFGADRRGVALVFCKTILKNGYKLIYVSPKEKINCQPTLYKELDNGNVEFVYYELKGSFVGRIEAISKAFVKYRPKFAFLYSNVNDSAGCCVFNALDGLVCRCKLDLTDHAFWIGVNAFDICNGGRPISTSIQYYYRGIPREKLTMLDASLFVDECEFQGLPFDESKRFVFSGGELYKTLGDVNNTYYKIVNHILKNHTDVIFLYAGSGDDTELNKIKAKYPERVFHICERPDFYQIIQRCTLYLNTFPMFGALMMRYASLAGKLPITLKHNNDSDDILVDQSRRKIEYDSYEELIDDLDKLLNDEEYLHQREEKLIGSVVTDECFARNIKLLIEEHRTEFPINKIDEVDTDKFRQEFYERFTFKDVYISIADIRNIQLLRYFPKEYIMGIFCKLTNRIKWRLL